MDNADLIPPTPKSLSDWELEQALETAKAQSDGMLAAMILLEQESQLRTEDDSAMLAWIARVETIDSPEARAALKDFYLANSRFSRNPVANESEQVLATAIDEPEQLPEISADEEVAPAQNIVEAVPAPIIPLPVPTPVSQEVAFDEMLAIGAAEATDAIELPETDFSVTGVLGQIVDRVNFDFSADEDATALEESEHVPISAFESQAEPTSPTKLKSEFVWSTFWQPAVVFALAIPLLAALWASQQRVSLATLVVGVAAASILNFALQSVFRSVSLRGNADATVLSRATFGVFANTLPVLFVWLFRSALLVVAAFSAVLALMPTFAGAPVAAGAAIVGLSWSTVLALCCLVAAISVSLFSPRVRTWVLAIATGIGFALVAAALIIRGFGLDLSNLDLAQVSLLAVVTLVASLGLSGIAQNALQQSESNQARRSQTLSDLISMFILPIVSVAGFGLLLSAPVGTSTGFTSLDELFLQFPLWLANVSVWVAVLLALVLLGTLGSFASESLSGLFIGRKSIRALITFLAAMAIAVAIGLESWLLDYLSKIILILLIPVSAWLGAFITEGILRRTNFHEVSLQRSYAFYKRVSVPAILGFILAVAIGVGLSPIDSIAWTGFLSKWLDPLLIFGNLSGAIWALVVSVVWSLITSLPKIHKQELEIAAIDERRSEIAGVVLPQ